MRAGLVTNVYLMATNISEGACISFFPCSAWEEPGGAAEATSVLSARC